MFKNQMNKLPLPKRLVRIAQGGLDTLELSRLAAKAHAVYEAPESMRLKALQAAMPIAVTLPATARAISAIPHPVTKIVGLGLGALATADLANKTGFLSKARLKVAGWIAPAEEAPAETSAGNQGGSNDNQENPEGNNNQRNPGQGNQDNTSDPNKGNKVGKILKGTAYTIGIGGLAVAPRFMGKGIGLIARKPAEVLEGVSEGFTGVNPEVAALVAGTIKLNELSGVTESEARKKAIQRRDSVLRSWSSDR